MYATRLQLFNYGPIEQLDLRFPFNDDMPTPIVLVGENGSGKSILLSHIVNGLVAAKSAAYPATPEVDRARVYKLRSGLYITSGRDYYFARIDFEDDLYSRELRTRTIKANYNEMPPGLMGTAGEESWNEMQNDDIDHYSNNFSPTNPLDPSSISIEAQRKLSENCVLYFPPDRFEDPAWLNEGSLIARAEHTNIERMHGHTIRKVIADSPLRANQNWLFDVIYDRAAFEARMPTKLFRSDANDVFHLKTFEGYDGDATRAYEAALQIVREVIKEPTARFGIGRRDSRAVSLQTASGIVVPNIFQLSSGETSLLNLFLSVLRDFDMCDVPFTNTFDIRGVVVVDEVDLHLHTSYQYEVLPRLIQMFPRVQFIITTHSPLFVLGMENLFREDGFTLYRLPRGEQIDAEEFSEFSQAYRSFAETRTYAASVREAIKSSEKHIVYPEGPTDVQYLKRAAELLRYGDLLSNVDLQPGGGDNLKNLWKALAGLTRSPAHGFILLLHDCDYTGEATDKDRVFRRKIQRQEANPVDKGIENLFTRATLEKAQSYKRALVDVNPARVETRRGKEVPIPEQWTIDDQEKTNLCNWICENGTAEDFEHFRGVLDMLQQLVDEEGNG